MRKCSHFFEERSASSADRPDLADRSLNEFVKECSLSGAQKKNVVFSLSHNLQRDNTKTNIFMLVGNVSPSKSYIIAAVMTKEINAV